MEFPLTGIDVEQLYFTHVIAGAHRADGQDQGVRPSGLDRDGENNRSLDLGLCAVELDLGIDGLAFATNQLCDDEVRCAVLGIGRPDIVGADEELGFGGAGDFVVAYANPLDAQHAPALNHQRSEWPNLVAVYRVDRALKHAGFVYLGYREFHLAHRRQVEFLAGINPLDGQFRLRTLNLGLEQIRRQRACLAGQPIDAVTGLSFAEVDFQTACR